MKTGRAPVDEPALSIGELIFAPRRVLEYVVVHELAHLRTQLTGQSFEELWRKYCLPTPRLRGGAISIERRSTVAFSRNAACGRKPSLPSLARTRRPQPQTRLRDPARLRHRPPTGLQFLPKTTRANGRYLRFSRGYSVMTAPRFDQVPFYLKSPRIQQLMEYS